ncbi:hypothetical protein DFH09DRAFT_1311426 [Mycena vulgaris]|nr:hypothetical protein DFH09DRAFT_1311426 [Mycena vulgaris]
MFLRLFGAYSVFQGSLSGAGPDGRGFYPGPRPLARSLTLAAGPTAWSFSLAAGPTAWCRTQRGLNIFDAVMAEHRDAFEIVQKGCAHFLFLSTIIASRSPSPERPTAIDGPDGDKSYLA